MSGQIQGTEIDLGVVVDPARNDGKIEHAEILIRFADAAMAREPEALAAARKEVRVRIGESALIRACAVLGNFERMNRIADATGIALDAPSRVLSEDLRQELDLDRFASAKYTGRASLPVRLAGPIVRRLARFLLPKLARRISKRS